MHIRYRTRHCGIYVSNCFTVKCGFSEVFNMSDFIGVLGGDMIKYRVCLCTLYSHTFFFGWIKAHRLHKYISYIHFCLNVTQGIV